MQITDKLREICARYPSRALFAVPRRVQAAWRLPQAAWTYEETAATVEALARRYRDAGYGPGHRVALLLENRPQHFFHWLALNALGASVVPLNPDLRPDETAYQLAHSESALVVALSGRVDAASEVAATLGIPVAVDDAAGFPPAARTPAAAAAAAGEEAECALLYTSGTTGKPKGCILTNGYFLGFGEWYAAQRGYIALRDGEERLLQPLPTFHINAMANSFIGMLFTGGAQVILDRFHPRQWWAEAVETRATCFHYLGVMPAMLLALPAAAHDRAHDLRFGMGGGVQPAHHAAFEERFGTRLLEGWAMTETGGGGIMCAMDEPRHVGGRCIGRPGRAGPPMEARVVDEHGDDVAPGVPGELLVRARGPDPRRRFFGGYLKDAEATAAAWAGGWLHTGDIVRRGEDGSFFFVDRRKNIIRRSGENISAVEVEAALASHPAVRQVGVLAVADEIREEEVMAVVALHDPAQAGAALAGALFDHCRERLAYHKAPGYVAFVATLPTTATQKIRK
ncbi:MAG: AMP-binding protein, partial [Burkholderiales bacterium]|nr:AMP-binding protein [Burkholderiales bacterium]